MVEDQGDGCELGSKPSRDEAEAGSSLDFCLLASCLILDFCGFGILFLSFEQAHRLLLLVFFLRKASLFPYLFSSQYRENIPRSA